MISTLYFRIFLLLGIAVSYEDWREKRIRNRWIACGIAACALGLGYLMLNSILGYQRMRLLEMGEYYLPWAYFPKVAAHLFLSFTAAFTLWRLRVWPAGDAKLFTLFAFFLALIDPNLPGFPLLLFMVLLINVFVPAGLVFAAETSLRGLARLPQLARMDLGKELKALGDRLGVRLREAWPYRYDYLALAVNLFAVFFALRLAEARWGRLAPGPIGHLAVYFLIFVLWQRLSALLRIKAVGLIALALVAAGSCLAAFHFHRDMGRQLLAGLGMTLNFGVFLSLARTFFYHLIEQDSLRDMDPEALKPGVILSDDTWERLKAEKFFPGESACRYPDGLSEDEVGVLKAGLAGKSGGGSGQAPAYTVYHSIPFAVWIFLGALLTLSCRTTVVSLLARYLKEAAETLAPHRLT